MTTPLALCLFLLAAEVLLNVAARTLDSRRPLPEPPAEAAGILDPERIAKTRAYTLARARHANRADLTGLLLLAGFLLLGGLPWTETLAESFGLGAVPTGLLFFGVLGMLNMLAELPFDLTLTFGLERRFGFGTITPGTYALDRLKGLALAVLLGGTLLSLTLWLFGAYGPGAWVYCWAAASVLMVALQYIAPTWLLPLFNTFTPLAPGPLREGLEELARRAGFTLSGIFVMDGSRRTTKANAFFAGMGRKKRIALYDTLLANHPDRDIVAVMAHEAGHAALWHIPVRLGAAVLQIGILFALVGLFLCLPSIPAAFGLGGAGVHGALVVFGLFFGPVSLLLNILLSALSRRQEYQADAYAAELTADPEALIQALARLSANNLSEISAHPLLVALSWTHPPVLERIRALSKKNHRKA
jgi:Zn-dependent protease with chaperone function